MSKIKTVTYTMMGSVTAGVVFGAMGACSSALSSFLGSSMLSSRYKGYDIEEAVQTCATGGAVLNGAAGALVGTVSGYLKSQGLFKCKPDYKVIVPGGIAWYMISQEFGALIGHALFVEMGKNTMDLDKTMVSAAVGIPFSLSIFLLITCYLAAVRCCEGVEKIILDNEPSPSV